MKKIFIMLFCLLFATVFAQKSYTAVLKTNGGASYAVPVSRVQSVDFVESSEVKAEYDYNWQYGGINASTGEIYYRDVRLYSNLLKVREGDVIKTDGYPYVIVFYNNDSTWNHSDYSVNGFRNRDYLIKENGLIRLLVAKADFSKFTTTDCKVWVQHGGYERNADLAVKYPQLFPHGKFGLQAHRGLSDEYPENTVLSFEQAAKEPIYKGMETDAQMTSDGVLVCMHDNTIDRTTNGTGKVSDYTFAQLQEFYIDGGYGWNEKFANQLKVPTLEAYLDICKEHHLVPYVELKLLTYEGIKKVVELIKAKGFAEGEYVLTSFTKDYLIYAATICDAPLEFMANSFTEAAIASNVHLKNIVIRPSSTKVTKELVQQCHLQDVLVECYGITVGGEELVKKLIQFGVEGGTCNSWKNLGLKNE